MPADLSAATAVQTVTRFYRHLDDRNYKAIAALMAPGGVWHRQGAQLSGEAAILEALGKRAPTLVIHHLLSNLFADIAADGSAEVTAYMLVARYDSGSPLTGPAPFNGIENIRTIRVKLVPTAEGWRVQRMSSDPISFASP
jgi:limonene-1,2-epoxide hydrolase